MTNLLQSPPLVILGQADIGQVRQYQDDPFTLKAWPKKTVFATTMLEQLCALELLLLRVQRLQTWRMDDQSLIQQVGSAQRAIQSAWHEAGTREITEIKRQLQEWCAYDLYPLAVASLGYDDTDAEVPRNRNDTSIQAHYHQMSMLSQTLATCQCLLKTISCRLGAKRVSYHLASLHHCLIMGRQASFVGYKNRIEQRFAEITGTQDDILDAEQQAWVRSLAEDVQARILQMSVKDQYEPLRGCSSLFDVMKTTTNTA